jgi:hypothetical protein
MQLVGNDKRWKRWAIVKVSLTGHGKAPNRGRNTSPVFGSSRESREEAARSS